jgi:hypothetical protein
MLSRSESLCSASYSSSLVTVALVAVFVRLRVRGMPSAKAFSPFFTLQPGLLFLLCPASKGTPESECGLFAKPRPLLTGEAKTFAVYLAFWVG